MKIFFYLTLQKLSQTHATPKSLKSATNASSYLFQGGKVNLSASTHDSEPQSAVRSSALLTAAFSSPENSDKAKGVRRPLPSRKSSATYSRDGSSSGSSGASAAVTAGAHS